MAPRRYRQHQPKTPRGMFLAWMAITLQAMLPFFLAVAIVRTATSAYADNVPICSALGIHHSSDQTDRHSAAGGCPVCAALAATHSYMPPPAVLPPLPQTRDRLVLLVLNVLSLSPRASSPYQSTGPPATA